MGVFRSQDSLSRCDSNLYSSLYDTRARPAIKDPTHVTAPPSVQKDSLEISKDKITADALSRLRHTSRFVIAHSGFMRVGKFLFLATALPPYLLFYRLPCYLAMQGIPALIMPLVPFVQKVVLEGKKAVFAPLNTLKKKLVFAVTHLMGPVVRLLKATRAEIRHYFLRLNSAFLRIKDKWAARLLQFGNIKKRAESAIKGAQEVLSKALSLLIAPLQTAATWITALPLASVAWSQWVAVKWKRLFQREPRKERQSALSYQAAKKWAEKAATWIADRTQRGFERFKEDISPLLRLLALFWKGAVYCLKIGSSPLMLGWVDLSARIKQKHRQALTALRGWQERLARFSHRQWATSLLQKIASHQALSKLPDLFRARFKQFLLHPFVQFFLKAVAAVVTLIARVFRVFLWTTEKGLALTGISIAYVCRLGRATVQVVSLLTQPFRRLSQAIVITIKAAAFRCLYFFILTIVMIGILFVWGIHYLGRLTAPRAPADRPTMST